ncbi:MAG: AAA family ATPase [Erysipelotrichaceae bacterium]
MRKYLNPGCTRYQVNKDLLAGKEKELVTYVSSKINTKEKRICIAHPEGSGKSDLLNFLMSYYGDNNDNLFEFEDEHSGNYDVIKISLKELLLNNPEDSLPVEMMYHELLSEVKSEYKLVGFDSKDELSDVLRKIYAATKRQFMIFIDDFDYIDRNWMRYVRNVNNCSWYIPELVPDTDDKHIALVYITGVLPLRSTSAEFYLKNFKEYTIYNPNVLTDTLRKNTHSSGISHIRYLIYRNKKLTIKYVIPLICGIKVPVNLDKFLYASFGERAALAILSYMNVIKYENHTVYLDDEKMRLYLLNAIDSKRLDELLETKNVFEEKYVIDRNMEISEVLNDILVHNFNMAIRYKLPEIRYYDDYVEIAYCPKDEYKEAENKRLIHLGYNVDSDYSGNAQIVRIKI